MMVLIIRTFAKKKDLVVNTASIVHKEKATLRSTVLSQFQPLPNFIMWMTAQQAWGRD